MHGCASIGCDTHPPMRHPSRASPKVLQQQRIVRDTAVLHVCWCVSSCRLASALLQTICPTVGGVSVRACLKQRRGPIPMAPFDIGIPYSSRVRWSAHAHKRSLPRGCVQHCALPTGEPVRNAKDVKVGFRWDPGMSRWIKDDKLQVRPLA